jgi:hypothetical protein
LSGSGPGCTAGQEAWNPIEHAQNSLPAFGAHRDIMDLLRRPAAGLDAPYPTALSAHPRFSTCV